jgi:NAD(P)-dependent dehydrogenase (short-subunit alcohol dehydrogenase family)
VAAAWVGKKAIMGKVWFVTGASAGIGAGVVSAALEAGDRVVATARNVEKLRSAIGGPESDRLAFVSLDVTRERQAQQAASGGRHEPVFATLSEADARRHPLYARFGQ